MVNAHILIIEDDEVLNNQLAELLAGKGFAVLNQLRNVNQTPVRMITACQVEKERIKGYLMLRIIRGFNNGHN